jgi:hypothetical protein
VNVSKGSCLRNLRAFTNSHLRVTIGCATDMHPIGILFKTLHLGGTHTYLNQIREGGKRDSTHSAMWKHSHTPEMPHADMEFLMGNSEPCTGHGFCSSDFPNTCTCLFGFKSCTPVGTSYGCETNVNYDVNNCGQCGNSCTAPGSAGPICCKGQCTTQSLSNCLNNVAFSPPPEGPATPPPPLGISPPPIFATFPPPPPVASPPPPGRR